MCSRHWTVTYQQGAGLCERDLSFCLWSPLCGRWLRHGLSPRSAVGQASALWRHTDAGLWGLCASHSSHRCQLITGAWTCGSVPPAPQRIKVLNVFLAIAAQKVKTGSLSPPRIQEAREVWTSKQAAENLCWMNRKFKFIAGVKPADCWALGSSELQDSPPPYTIGRF